MNNRKLSLEYRVAKLEKAVKNEAKQVGTIYHVCTLRAYLKYVLPEDQLVASGKYYNNVYGGDNYVSFTRDKSFVLDSRDDDIVLVQIVVDGDKLSERYKIGPYNDFAFGENGERRAYDDPRRREMEEAVKGPIKNLSKYVKEVRFDIAATHNLTEEQDLGLLKRKRRTLSHLVYHKFIRGKSANFGCQDGASLAEALKCIDNWYMEESKQEQLFSYSLAKVKKAIEAGANVNKKNDADGYPLVYYSEDDDSVPIIKALLKAGADPNVMQSDGMPVLCYTIDNWTNEVGKVLVKAGADLDKKDIQGMTALMHASDAVNDEMVKVLLKSGADVNAKDNKGNTALMYASKSGELKIIKWLIDAGADVNATNSSGEDAVAVASDKKVATAIKKAKAA